MRDEPASRRLPHPPGRTRSTVRGRIELNPDLAPVLLPRRVLNEMCSHALETHPEECCGLVAGDESERFAGVFRCRNEMTKMHRSDPSAYPRDGRHAFFMNESDLLKAQREAEVRAQHVTGVYHSHIDAGAYFSETDQAFAEQELFPFPTAAHIVIAVWERRVARVGLFERDPAAGGFRGRAVEARER
jgi:proteasome lid subunit RPN8/RPN11